MPLSIVTDAQSVRRSGFAGGFAIGSIARSAYRKNRAGFMFPGQGSGSVKEGARNTDKTGIKSASDARFFRVIAGPELAPAQLHCATVPDGPDRKWIAGRLERIEAQNRAALREHFDKLAAKERAEIEANGEFTEPEWREVISPDGVRCFVTPFRDAPAADATDLIATIPDDLSIPNFLRRTA